MLSILELAEVPCQQALTNRIGLRRSKGVVLRSREEWRKQCSTTPETNVVILLQMEENEDSEMLGRGKKRKGIVEEQDDSSENIAILDMEDLELVAF